MVGREEFLALSWQRATLYEYLVAIQIKTKRRHKREPQAQYATGLGLGSLLPQLRPSELGGSSCRGWGPPSSAAIY